MPRPKLLHEDLSPMVIYTGMAVRCRRRRFHAGARRGAPFYGTRAPRRLPLPPAAAAAAANGFGVQNQGAGGAAQNAAKNGAYMRDPGAVRQRGHAARAAAFGCHAARAPIQEILRRGSRHASSRHEEDNE